MLVLSPLCAVTAEVSGVLVRTMVMNAGLELARFARLGGQSDHFQCDSEQPDLTARFDGHALHDMLARTCSRMMPSRSGAG